MSEKRSYVSPYRDRAAAATRETILRCATVLFAEHGYARITVADIAASAGVAVRTVYASAGNKAEILDRIVDEAVAASGYRRTVEEISRTDSPEEALRLLARGTGAGNRSQETALTAVRQALPVHESGEDLWRRATEVYREALRAVAGHLHALGQLPPGLDPEQTADLLWLLFGPNSWHTLVHESGWSWEAAEELLHRTAVAAFARPA
ncbi:TetR/AcrR family transcriptional regulator [Micromonospora psammae]|uniref:TetR/AcrR family transcriptional regulator n=1 Tax=Micromonospora sp. CPCC 205556 TaxID=3122398 RepID=UPI002FEE98A7